MSFMMYEVECDKCHKRVMTSFGIVGMQQIAAPVRYCQCGGRYKQVEDYNIPESFIVQEKNRSFYLGMLCGVIIMGVTFFMMALTWYFGGIVWN